jgi:hypothetical protein
MTDEASFRSRKNLDWEGQLSATASLLVLSTGALFHLNEVGYSLIDHGASESRGTRETRLAFRNQAHAITKPHGRLTRYPPKW